MCATSVVFSINSDIVTDLSTCMVVWLTLAAVTCSIYMLRDKIRDVQEKNLSLSMIWRTLRHTGYSRKKVSDPYVATY